MSYAFLRKAQLQPDLSDFCDYVKKPLSVLEDILHRYEELQLSKKVTSSNLEIYHKCDSILQKHLPEMVDNFCDFSFEYRNNEKIQVSENIALTPKELLLKNLGKIIEEVKVIEKEFNHNNAFNTLAQTKVLSNYGFQPQLSLQTGQITKEEIKLDNKFDFEKFVENNQFKQPVLVKEEEIIPATETSVEQKEEPTEVAQGGSLFLMTILILILPILLMILAMANGGSTDDINFENKLKHIENKIAKAYEKEKFDDLSNEMLIKSEILTEEDLKTPWGAIINVNQDVYGSKTDGKYTLTFNMVSQYSKDRYDGDDCDNVAHVANNYSMVSFAQYVVKSQDDISKSDFVNYCEGKVSPEFKFPTNSVTLVSK